MIKHLICFILLSSTVFAKDAISIQMQSICMPPFSDQAIYRKDPLFIDDFWVLHSLLKMAKPMSVFEIGTCTGEGTLIIKNAVGDGVVYSLELPLGESTYDIQKIGEQCYLPYVQIIGNSKCVDYTHYYPIEAWFIDGAHDYNHVLHETQVALLSTPLLIVWHDADIPEVFEAIKDGLEGSDYLLYRVKNTRIAFSIPASSFMRDWIHD